MRTRLATLGAFAATAFTRQLAYRVANWSGLFTNAFFLFIRAYALEACFTARDAIGGMDVAEVLTYTTITQMLVMVCPIWGTLGLGDRVRSGDVALDLVRPVSVYALMVSQRLGVSAYYLLMRGLPVAAIGAAAGLLSAPASVWLVAPWLVSVALGAFIGASLLFLVDVSSFWLESERGLRYVAIGLTGLLSGLFLPLPFFPSWAQGLSRALPFQYTLHLPVEIWLGRLDGPALALALGMQILWAVALAGICTAVLRAGTRRLVIHGG